MLIDMKAFQSEIENIVKGKRVCVLDAIIIFCDDRNIDPEDVKGLISPNLKNQIRKDAITQGLMKSTPTLPV